MKNRIEEIYKLDLYQGISCLSSLQKDGYKMIKIDRKNNATIGIAKITWEKLV